MRRLTVAGIALVLAAGGGAAYVVTTGSAPARHATHTPPPHRPAVLAALSAAAPTPTGAGLSTALRGPLAASALGGSVSIAVLDARSGQQLYGDRSDALVPPASTTKLATAIAALRVLGPTTRLQTRAVLAAPDTVVLVGGGDPTLTSAQLRVLATETARALTPQRLFRVRVAYDISLFSGPSAAPGWSPVYVSEGDVSPVSSLELDTGHDRRPALAAAEEFATLLRHAGLHVDGTPAPTSAPRGAAPLADVRSAPVSDLVQQMLTVSDNDLAEALARQVALRRHLPATFAGGAAAVRQTLAALGIDPAGFRTVDGSGLSTQDRVQPLLTARLLILAASPAHPELRPVITGLPVAGFVGTLATRFRSPPARAAAGLVRAKTGTLAGVSALAGLAVDADGRLLAFALVADHAPYYVTAEAALDRVAATLAACGCR